MPRKPSAPPIGSHGSADLPAVTVESYNIEIRDHEGFIGDRASKGAFLDLIEELRKKLVDFGDDPLGDTPTEDLDQRLFDKLLAAGNPEAAGIVQGAAETFAQRLASVIRRFLRRKTWRGVERIAVGGGFRQSRLGEIVIGRTEVILKEQKVGMDLVPIRHHPDEAGLIGAVHLAPKWMFKAHDAILAVDIGGTNIRAGVVGLNLKKAADLSKAFVWKFELWRHGDEKKVSREDAVKKITGMLEGLIEKAAKEKLALAPFIGIGCPGIINKDGSIERGAQNLPGNWESRKFHLPSSLHEAIPKIGNEDTAVVMHNDAVVQGLSEAPFMTDVERWGALTIGTGLGNARFTNRTDE